MAADYPPSVWQLSGIPGAITHRRNFVTGEWIELPEPLFVDYQGDMADYEARLGWLERLWAEGDGFEHRVYVTEGVPRSPR